MGEARIYVFYWTGCQTLSYKTFGAVNKHILNTKIVYFLLQLICRSRSNWTQSNNLTIVIIVDPGLINWYLYHIQLVSWQYILENLSYVCDTGISLSSIFNVLCNKMLIWCCRQEGWLELQLMWSCFHLTLSRQGCSQQKVSLKQVDSEGSTQELLLLPVGLLLLVRINTKKYGSLKWLNGLRVLGCLSIEWFRF